MADIYDQATDVEMRAREIAIQQSRTVKVLIKATGVCLECAEPVPDDVRWCCKDCRDDWQRWNPQA